MKQSFRIFTLGCKVNQYESQVIREKFLSAGFRETSKKRADIYLINTCTVTHHADRSSRQLTRLSLHANPRAKVLITGCYVERDARRLVEISDRVRIIRQREKYSALSLLTKHKAQHSKLLRSSFHGQIAGFIGHQRAFVKIQDGCDNFCAYCKVPLVRGRSRSRPLKQIVSEAKCLLENGFKEIVLTGICLGDYHYRNFELADVVAALSKIKCDFRIRLSSVEPQLVSLRLIESLNSPKVCPHLHIPLQSGDNTILGSMNRQYTRSEYLGLIKKINKRVKDVAITTDVLVGFPNESDKNFQNTIDCIKKIAPLRTHIFSFSPRPGTAAFSLSGRIDSGAIKARVNQLKEVTDQCSLKFRQRFLGRKLEVLVEAQPDQQNKQFSGYSENYIRVQVANATKKHVGQLTPVKINSVGPVLTTAYK
ncbi:tRNA (N(6)-L-threonylcarbamoyladenosine(37)-C(2))-methylthiotransferase MtaB [Candidatus Omnitrophota bacterium]